MILVVTVIPGNVTVARVGDDVRKVMLVVTVTVGRAGPVPQYLPKQVGQLGGIKVVMVVVMVGSTVRVRVRVTVVVSYVQVQLPPAHQGLQLVH